MSHEDPTEGARIVLAGMVNADPGERAALEATHGQVWDTGELQRDFAVLGFAAPFVVVRRRSDGVKGSLTFQHGPPRLYWGFQEDRRND